MDEAEQDRKVETALLLVRTQLKELLTHLNLEDVNASFIFFR